MPSRLQPLGKDQKNKILNSLFYSRWRERKIKVENGLHVQFALEPNSIISVYEVYLMYIRIVERSAQQPKESQLHKIHRERKAQAQSRKDQGLLG